MTELKKVVAICGSTRAQSTNLNVIRAFGNLAAETIELQVFEGLTNLPHFNPDIDTETPPEAITAFREIIRNADGVLICTPEYAMGVPGTLKNALDWTVSSSDFSGKPLALITASTGGAKAHESLIGTLRMIEAQLPDDCQLLISFAKTKVNHHAEFTDSATLESVRSLLDAFVTLMMDNTHQSNDDKLNLQ